MSEAYQKIVSLLQINGIEHRIIEHEPMATGEDVGQGLPFPIEMLIKTLVYRIRDSFWVFVALKCEERLDFGKLARSLGIGRDKLEKPGKETVEMELGFPTGGIGPFPLCGDVILVIDKKVMDLERIYCGIGRTDRSLEIHPEDLLTLVSPVIGDVTK